MVSKRRKNKGEKKVQKRTEASTSENEKITKGKWAICPDCGVSLKLKNLSSHLKKVHSYVSDSKIREIKKTLKRRNGSQKKHVYREKSNFLNRKRNDIIFFTVLIIIIGSIFGGYFIYLEYFRTDETNEYDSGQSAIDDNNPPQDNKQPPVDGNWLDNYIPQYFTGSGENCWWKGYPNKHPNAGESVNHSEWIKQDLDTNTVLIVIHKTGCIPCAPQAEKAGEIAEKYPDDLIFHDLDVADGSDTYDKGMETFIYDPDNAQNYIALTVVLTLIKDESDNVSIAWHSWEGDMDKSVLESWVKDAIYNYKQNESSWSSH